MNPVTILQQLLWQGSVWSASAAVPSGATKAIVTLMMAPADAAAGSGKSLRASLETYRAASGWYTPGYQSWQAGQSLTLTFGGWGSPLPSEVRLALDLPQILSVGATIAFS